MSLAMVLLAACGSVPRAGRDSSAGANGQVPAQPPAGSAQAPGAAAYNRPYTVLGRRYVPEAPGAAFRQRGLASWYGSLFQGKRTSNGEIFDMNQLTAAHPTLPLPSYARVTNLATGVWTIVRVNDRGPFKPDRIIDLSYAAAKRLGFAGRGTAEVEVEKLSPKEVAVLSTGVLPPPQRLTVQPAAAVRADGDFAQADPPPAPPTPPVAAVQAEPTVAAAVMPQAAPRPPLAAALPSPSPPTATQARADAGAAVPVGSAASASPAPVPAPQTDTPPGFFAQLGAYRDAEGAASMAARAAALPALVGRVLQVSAGDWVRVLAGPYISRGEAQRAASQAAAALGVSPWVQERK